MFAPDCTPTVRVPCNVDALPAAMPKPPWQWLMFIVCEPLLATDMLSVGQYVEGAAVANCGHRLPTHNSAMANQEKNEEKKMCEDARGVLTLCVDS
ncbi:MULTISPECIES: hypothetical protein [Stenotrophomonas]|uniref:hypothetical protein n=1 Tax=Stenotrophomonas TaxID=40323 RepID=UPI000709BBE6|nr:MULTISPECIES: hypothetical protein [Stenotrophomonas]